VISITIPRDDQNARTFMPSQPRLYIHVLTHPVHSRPRSGVSAGWEIPTSRLADKPEVIRPFNSKPAFTGPIDKERKFQAGWTPPSKQKPGGVPGGTNGFGALPGESAP
jgi:hypothetical protein